MGEACRLRPLGLVLLAAALVAATGVPSAMAAEARSASASVAKEGDRASAQASAGDRTVRQEAMLPSDDPAEALQFPFATASDATERAYGSGDDVRAQVLDAATANAIPSLTAHVEGTAVGPYLRLAASHFHGHVCSQQVDWPPRQVGCDKDLARLCKRNINTELECDDRDSINLASGFMYADCHESDGAIKPWAIAGCYHRETGESLVFLADKLEGQDAEAATPGFRPADAGVASSDPPATRDGFRWDAPRAARIDPVPESMAVSYGVEVPPLDVPELASQAESPAVNLGMRGASSDEAEQVEQLTGGNARLPVAASTIPSDATPPVEVVFAGEPHAPLKLQASEPASGNAVSGDRSPALSAVFAVAGILGLAAVALYHRIRSDRLLAHPTRARVLDAVRASPGLELSALATTLGVHRTTLEHHVRLMAMGRLLTLVQGPRSLRIYSAGAADASRHARTMDATGSAVAQRVVAELRTRPGASLRALARATGADRSTVRYHVERLVAAGVLVDQGAEGSRRLAVAASPAVSGPPAPVGSPATP